MAAKMNGENGFAEDCCCVESPENIFSSPDLGRKCHSRFTESGENLTGGSGSILEVRPELAAAELDSELDGFQNCDTVKGQSEHTSDDAPHTFTLTETDADDAAARRHTSDEGSVGSERTRKVSEFLE